MCNDTTAPQATPADEFRWSDAQLAAINERNRTLLLSAAAGTGKTTTLTERVIRMLTDKDRPLSISRMVIVTFTVAAASELKTRLTAALNKAIEKNPSDDRLPVQLLLLADADIGTVDSFCRRIVAEFADKANLSPNYRVCDAEEEEHLLRSVMTPFIDRLFAGEEPPGPEPVNDKAAAFCDLVSHLVESRRQDELAAIFLRVWRETETIPEGVDKLDEYAGYIEAATALPPEKTVFGKALLSRIVSRYRDAKNAAEALLSDLAGEPDTTKAVLGAPLSEVLEISRALSDPDVSYDGAREQIFRAEKLAIPTFNPKSAFYKDGTESFVLGVKAFLQGFRNAVKGTSGRKVGLARFFLAASDDWKTVAAIHLPLSRLLSRVIRRFSELVAEEKRRRNVASFADVERAAYRVLVAPDGSKTDAARAIARRYDEILVDEYQDINPIQHAVFEAISGERNRFLVGDVKQSIYVFRRADPEIFLKMKTSFPPLDRAGDGPCATLFLSENRRCDEPIIRFVNGVFDALFGAAGDAIGYTENDRLVFAKKAAACNPTPILPVVRMFASPPKTADEVGEDPESAWVADEIVRLLNEERHPDGSPFKPGEIAILLRSARPAPIFRASLLKRGVPVSIETKENFFESPEIRLALCLLNAVDNPRRDVPLVGLLRSPLFNFSFDDLSRIRREARNCDEPFYDALTEYCNNHPDFTAGTTVLSRLAEYRRAAEGMPVDRLILKMFTETGLLPIGGASNANGREKLLLFYQYARAFEATSFRGLYRFISYMNDLAANGQELNLQPPSNAGGVQIMTIHHSKGLERAAVFVARSLSASKGAGPTPGGGNVAFSPRFGLTSKVHDATGLARIDTPFRQIAEYEKDLAEKEEALRVLYVALTRARERLYVTGKLPANQVKNKVAGYYDAPPISRTEVLSKSLPFDWILRAVGPDTPLAAVSFPACEDDAAEQPADSAAPAVYTGAAVPTGGIPGKDGALLSDDAAAKLLNARFRFEYPFPWLRKVPGKLSVSVLSPAVLDADGEKPAALSQKKENAEPERPRFLSQKTRADDPALRGTATHAFLQFCDLSRFRRDGADAEISRLIAKEFLPEDVRDYLSVPELEMLRASSLTEELLGATRIWRELRFNMMLDASSFTEKPETAEQLKNQLVLVQGVIDCAFFSREGELVLVDYKTDRLKGGAAADKETVADFVKRHSDQLKYYSIALERMFGRAPDRIWLYPLCLGRPILVTL